MSFLDNMQNKQSLQGTQNTSSLPTVLLQRFGETHIQAHSLAELH